MTAQLLHRVRHRQHTYELLETEHTWQPLDLATLDWKIEPPSLQCILGFRWHVVVTRGELVLDQLEVGAGTRTNAGEVPTLFGFAPRPLGEWLVFAGINRPIEYSGRILIGDDEIDEWPTPPAYRFRTVLALHFDRGRLIHEAPVTPAELAAARTRHRKRFFAPINA